MSAATSCRWCGKILRVDYRPGEAPDRYPQLPDCQHCDSERERLTTDQVVVARHVPIWESNPLEDLG